MVECNLAKVEVAGSNPVSRSIFFLFFGMRQCEIGLLPEGHAGEIAGQVGRLACPAEVP